MRVYLGADKRQGYKPCANVAALSQQILDAEATEIYCDKFLSRHELQDVPKVIELICKKIRMNGILIIHDNDFGLISRQIFRDETGLDIMNSHVFPSGSKGVIKCMLDLQYVQKLLPPNFELSKANYSSHTFLLELRRVK
jgi:hypothetical protein